MLKKYYDTTLRSLLISKHNILNTFLIPKIKSGEINIKTDLKKNKKIWTIMFWSLYLLTGQKPSIKKKKESLSYMDTNYFYNFSVKFSKKKLYFFLLKYIYFILPKIEDIETFKNVTNKIHYSMEVKGFMNFFETIDIYNFVSDSDLYIINHLIFSLKLNMTSKQHFQNLTVLRGLQIPLHP